MSNYLQIARKAKNKVTEPTNPPVENTDTAATKATEATKVPAPQSIGCDRSDKSDQRVSFTPMTVAEALAEIHRWGSGAGKNAELYRRGDLTEEQAVEYVTCAILQHRGESFRVWKHHASAVRKALGYCIHERDPEECKVCNGYVRRMLEEEQLGEIHEEDIAREHEDEDLHLRGA